MNDIQKAAELIKQSKHCIAFTGAGISVESGIPPFRGQGGLWNKYNPEILSLGYFYSYPESAWKEVKKLFYEFFGKAKPNKAHLALAELEKKGYLKTVITQNIDNLHQEAGSKSVIEFHGTAQHLECIECKSKYEPYLKIKNEDVPKCEKCNSVLKPAFIFFEESIPRQAFDDSTLHASKADLMIVVGTTGEVMPASTIPYACKRNGAKILEINPEHSLYTSKITSLYLQGKAGEVLPKIIKELL